MGWYKIDWNYKNSTALITALIMDLAKTRTDWRGKPSSSIPYGNPHSSEFIDNLESEIDLNKIDFIVCNHGEVDHSGSLPALMEKIPNTPIYCTENAVKSFGWAIPSSRMEFQNCKTGDSVDIGNGKSWYS